MGGMKFFHYPLEDFSWGKAINTFNELYKKLLKKSKIKTVKIYTKRLILHKKLPIPKIEHL